MKCRFKLKHKHMNKVVVKNVSSEYDYENAKPKNATSIKFVVMEEGGGAYSISNKGHIRSNIGKPKILKWSYDNRGRARIGLRIDKNNPKKFMITSLMKKYYPLTADDWIKENNNVLFKL